jgi:hypothetical protein
MDPIIRDLLGQVHPSNPEEPTEATDQVPRVLDSPQRFEGPSLHRRQAVQADEERPLAEGVLAAGRQRMPGRTFAGIGRASRACSRMVAKASTLHRPPRTLWASQSATRRKHVRSDTLLGGSVSIRASKNASFRVPSSTSCTSVSLMRRSFAL